MVKKTLKVKKKMVKYKKKKSIISKSKKKKSTTKRVLKKKKRKRKKRIVMEDIYKILNKVQMNKKSITFTVDTIEADVIENVIKDASVQYQRTDQKTQIVFDIKPNDKENIDIPSILDIEYLDDEIAEEGQIFF